MSDVHTYSSDVAFTPAVKAIQARKGSREAYAHVEARGGWRTEIDENLAAFLAETNSFFLATASADGQPYIQHRGGPTGFVRMLDKNTLAFADFSGNRQYITQGNLAENPKAHLFLIDYAHRRRVKIWGEARVVEDDPALTAIADAARATRRGPSRSSCSRSRRGTPTARSTSRRTSTPPTSRRRWPCATPASPSSRPNWPPCGASLHRRHHDQAACSCCTGDQANSG